MFYWNILSKILYVATFSLLFQTNKTNGNHCLITEYSTQSKYFAKSRKLFFQIEKATYSVVFIKSILDVKTFNEQSKLLKRLGIKNFLQCSNKQKKSFYRFLTHNDILGLQSSQFGVKHQNRHQLKGIYLFFSAFTLKMESLIEYRRFQVRKALILYIYVWKC